MTFEKPTYLTTKEAAEYTTISYQTLVQDRCTRRHKIPFIKLGTKVIYIREDLDKYLNSKIVCGMAA